jgi:hypothetical protein
MKYAFWTGPTTVDQVALRLSEAGLLDVSAGTETAYFRLPHAREAQWSGPAMKRAEAQLAVDEVFPHADYRVFVTSNN